MSIRGSLKDVWQSQKRRKTFFGLLTSSGEEYYYYPLEIHNIDTYNIRLNDPKSSRRTPNVFSYVVQALSIFRPKSWPFSPLSGWTHSKVGVGQPFSWGMKLRLIKKVMLKQCWTQIFCLPTQKTLLQEKCFQQNFPTFFQIHVIISFKSWNILEKGKLLFP